MRSVDVALRRSQLLRAAAALLLGVATTACAEPWAEPRPVADAYRPAASAALDYLEHTDDELGLDVVVAIQVFSERTGDERAREVAELRRAGLRASDVERYGQLLEIDKPPFPPGSLDGVIPSAATPDPADTLDDRVASCPEEVLSCRVTPECREFVELDDRWGYVLTHQAVWLIFHRWMGCSADVDVDVEERRRTFAANLVRELEADPRASDLHAERLAMLGHLGFAAEIEPAWVDALVSAQSPSGCFPASESVPCHPHPTGLALWSLAHAPR